MEYYFEWPGIPVPYVRTTQRQKWVDPQYKRYMAFKKAFRVVADSGRIPSSLDPQKKYGIAIVIYTKRKLRGDLDNYVKSILDSLWEQDRQIKQIDVRVKEGWTEDRTVLSLSTLTG